MKVPVYNLANQEVGDVEVASEVFGAPIKPHLHHAVVVAQRASRRRGTAKVKGRSEVRGTTAKMYRQKGTGRARHGSRKAPIFVGGGTAFGPRPRSYAQRLNKKTRRAALRSVMTEKLQQNLLKIVENFDLEAIKTKTALDTLQTLQTKRALVVDAANDNLRLSVRNLKHYKFLAHPGLNVEDVLRFDHLIVTRAALEQIQGALMP